jgi:phage tail sheath gpL-like
MRRVTIEATAVAGLFAAAISAACAQSTDTYPDRPIKVVVPAATIKREMTSGWDDETA